MAASRLRTMQETTMSTGEAAYLTLAVGAALTLLIMLAGFDRWTADARRRAR